MKYLNLILFCCCLAVFSQAQNIPTFSPDDINIPYKKLLLALIFGLQLAITLHHGIGTDNTAQSFHDIVWMRLDVSDRSRK